MPYFFFNRISWTRMALIPFVATFLNVAFPNLALSDGTERVTAGNFGLPGMIDLPTARRFPDGELIISQQIHESLARSGISFQALPRVGLSFRYSGHGINGQEAYGRINHDRSFDAHISVLDESDYLPAISLGLRDFIGTGWYSSEYIVGSKSIKNFELTAGIGFGRLAGKNPFSNPLGVLSSRFDQRGANKLGLGGTLGSINWFHGDTSAFYGIQYHVNDKVIISTEYTPDIMFSESSYLTVKSPWNFGASYQLNNYVNFSAQYLHGSQVSVTAQVSVNPGRPPMLGGKELAPVPMRLRIEKASPAHSSDINTVRKVLAVDGFEIHDLKINDDKINLLVKNTKFRSTAQAIGRVASTLQRFTSNEIKFAKISFISGGIITASYQVNLEKITTGSSIQ